MALPTEDTPALCEAILKTLLYADIFDFPLTADEIAFYLIGQRADRSEVADLIEGDDWLAARVHHERDLYCLMGRTALISHRLAQASEVGRLWGSAERWGRILAHLPFVRGVLVTGALAANNPGLADDLDYLIITHPGRLWLARAGATTTVRLAALTGQRLCPNYLLAETALRLDEHNLFTARELAQMAPLFGRDVYRRIRAANDWTEAWLPGAATPLRDRADDRLHPLGGLIKGVGEWLLGGRIGTWLEGWVRRRKIAQLWRDVPPNADHVIFSPDVCKGHFEGHGQRILRAYEERLRAHGLAGEDDGRRTTDRDATTDYRPLTTNHWPLITDHRPTIAFDATTLLGPKSGVGYYTSHLLSHLLAEDHEHDYLLLSNRPLQGVEGGRALPQRYFFPNRSIWMQTVLPAALRAAPPALCHFTNSIAPLWNTAPLVVTIHDMTLSLFPRLHQWRKHLLARPLIPLVARQAAAIITVSHSAKRDIVRLLGVPEEKVHVIYEAAAPDFRPLPADRVTRVREKYGLWDRYILYVGTIEPRKNLVRLVEALARLRADGLPHKLLLVGQLGWRFQPIFQRIHDLRLDDAVICTGYVPFEDLPALYNLAEVFAFPSLYEGFGLPLVEAMACGTPAVTSARSSLGEIAEGAALTVNPYSVDDLADALGRALTRPSLATGLRERGLARAGQYSWQRAAQQTLAVYRHVLNGASDRRPRDD